MTRSWLSSPTAVPRLRKPRLRRRRETSASTARFAATWPDGVIPFWMERVALDVEGGHFGVADFDAFFVQFFVEFRANREARFGRGRRDQLDDRQPARQRPTPPVLRDRAEQAVFDLVPFRC